jgi:hypothetical protein
MLHFACSDGLGTWSHQELCFALLATLLQMCATLDMDSAAAAAAVCRLMLPSSCAWVLTAAGQGRYVGNRQLLADRQLMSLVLAAHGSSTTTTSTLLQLGTCGRDVSSSSSSSRDEQQQQQLCGFSSAAAVAACQPSQLLLLLELLSLSERSCSKHLQQTPQGIRLLHVTLDCCLLTWPAAAFDAKVLQELVLSALPALLASARSLSAMAGLRALHIVLLRSLLPAAPAGLTAEDTGKKCGQINCCGQQPPLPNSSQGMTESEQQQQQQQQQGAAVVAAGPHALARWLQALVEPVCLLLKSPTLAVRLEVSSSDSEQQ